MSELIGDSTRAIMNHCPRCDSDFEMAAAIHQPICPACIDRERADELAAWKAAALASLNDATAERLGAAGFNAVELSATLDRVPPELKHALPIKRVAALMHGDKFGELKGFGLSGGQGAGKTMCFAAIMRARTAAILTRLIEERKDAPEPSGSPWVAGASFSWINWPEKAAALKSLILEHGGAHAVEQFTHRASVSNLIVLDDLGRERLGKNYDEDFSFGVLDRIIDARSRAQLPLFWTSNLTRSGIASRYGAALTSRLLGLAPAVELPKLMDLRIGAG